MRNKILLGLVLLILVIGTINAYSASLSELLKIGRSQDEIQDALKAETKHYNNISKAISDNKIVNGMVKDDIFNEYGQPSVIVGVNDGQIKAVYKPSNKNYFDNEKVTLFFDKENKLINIIVGQT